MDFSIYDARKYPTVSVTDGYQEWAPTYEQTVLDEMDLRLLARLTTVAWAEVSRALDLACGTGRVGVWLKGAGVAEIDGVDLTPAMLDRARKKAVYRQLFVADVTDTGLPGGAYDLCTQSLADEHLPSLSPLYREAARLTGEGGRFVLVGYHPHFLLNGIPTHFDRQPGESVAIQSHVHLLSDHVRAAHAAGWSLLEMDEGLIDEDWLAKKPKWQRYFGLPVSFVMVWQKMR